jgi:hypothetical protein
MGGMSVRWWIPALLLLGVVFGVTAVACSSRDGGNTPGDGTVVTIPKSTGGTLGGQDSTVDGPASRYAPAESDLPSTFEVDVPKTFTQNISTFASSYLFDTAQQGNDLAQQWKIIDGFKVSYDPAGLAAAVLQGSYYIDVEVYLFQDTAGAAQAYTYIKGRLGSVAASSAADAKGLANESAAFQITQGTIASSDTPAIYDRFLFRRGNIVASVTTIGAKGKASIDAARNVAVIMDDRILGKRDSTEPTPIPTPEFHLQPTPEASGTAGAGS